MGASIGGFFGFSPIFGAQPDLALGAPIQLVYYAALGVVAGLGGLLYARVFYATTGVFHRLRLPLWLKPALGGLLVGGMIGATLWRLAYGSLPDLPQSPSPFVIVGMMALFGGIAHAPLAVMLMVAEMTGNLSMLAPAMVAVGVSTALVGDHTIYRSQLRNRASSPAHRVQFAFPLLSVLTVGDAMMPPRAAIRASA